MKYLKSLLLGIASVMAASVAMPEANAVPINGTVSFEGVGTLDTSSFLTATTFTSFSGVTVGTATGDYSGTEGLSVTMAAPFQFDPTLSLANPLWSINGTGFGFDLNSITAVYRFSSFLLLEGIGTAYGTGFDSQTGVWQLSTQGSATKFTWSSFSAVPDGGATVGLVGAAFLALAAVRRRTA